MLKIYRSSAGSGKTFTLVKEYLRICIQARDVNKYRHILAITFTNKACNEMKERIIHTLHDFAQGAPNEGMMLQMLEQETGCGQSEIIDFSGSMLDRILQDYSGLSISTIDSFIHKVIRSFAYELDIPHNFQVHLDRDELLDKIIAQLMDTITETEQSPIVQALIDFAEVKMEEGTGWNIEYALRQFTKEMLQEDSLPFLEKLAAIPVEQWAETQTYLQTTISAFEKQVSGIGKRIIQLIDEQQLRVEDFYYGKSGIYNYFQKLAKFPKEKIDRGARIESTIREGKWSSGKDKSAAGRIDAIAPQLESLVQEVIQLEETQGAKYYFAQQLRKNIYQLRVVEGISKAFEAVKEEENILAISEFQSLISKIVSVQDAPIIYERIGEKYDSILIDEFQDTSLLQFRNLLPLIENSQFKSEDSLIVGDAKQSIYRFKGGEAQQLVELPKVFGSDTSQILKEREVAINNYPTGTEVLNKNFRSRKNIIAFNNELYGLLSGKDELIQRIYTNHAQVCDEQKTGGFISIQEFNDKEEPEAKNVRVLEIIKECEAKDYSAGDIAILVRDNKRGSELANILMLEGYSIDTGESLLFTQSQAVNTLIAVLQYLSDPFNVLFRHELLHEISVTETMDFESLKALLHSAQSNFDVAISKHTQSTFDTAVLKQQSVFAVCEASAFLFALPVNDVFVTSFFDLVQDYLQKNGDSLADFLQWWDEVKTKKSIQSNVATSAIKIMTIHKSKGLQFPVVIMPDTDWQIRNSVSNVWLEEVEAIPISPILLPLESGLQKTEFGYLYDAEKQKAKLDNINLLYVATTRPVDRLYMLFSRHEQKDEETYVDQLLQPFLQANNFDNLTLEIGDPETRKIKSKKNVKAVNPVVLSTAAGGEVHQPDLKETRETFANDEILYGNLLHGLLADMAVQSFEKVVQRLETQQQYMLAKERLLGDVEFIRSHEVLKAYYEDDFERIVEFEMMDEQRKMHKPDMVAIRKEDGKTATIIDYKSGKEDEAYKVQINLYAGLLSRAGYSVEKKWIVYSQLQKVVEVV